MSNVKRPYRRSRRILRVLLILIALVVAIRIALPYIILNFANRSLANLDGYRGQVHDIDLAIIRGAYKIDSIYINRVDSLTHKETPFFAASLIDLAIEWRALLKGSLVGELKFTNPELVFTRDRVEPDDVREDSTTFKQLLDDFMPLKVNRFEVTNGKIRYQDPNVTPAVDVALTETNIVALNLLNSYDSASSLLPAEIRARANVYGGTLRLNMKLNPLAEVPTFDLDAALENTDLTQVNDFFVAYAKADISQGTFGLYTEVAAKDGRFNGYVKPLLNDVKVLGAEDRDDNILRKAWEALIGTVGEVFENQPRDRVATKVPLQGEVENPDANIWYAVLQVLQNAFIQAIQPSLDEEINIATVGAQPAGEKNNSPSVSGNNDQAEDRVEARKKRREERRQRREERRKEREGDRG